MKNEFEKYYETVQEHAKDMVNEIYDNLLDELKENNYGLKLETFLSWNENFISEYNNGLYITLRESVDVLEQSARLITDEAMYVHAGDCKEQVQAMAYWTYRNDLVAEFRIALKNKLENDLPLFESKMEEILKMIGKVDEEIESKEYWIEQLNEDLEKAKVDELPKTVKAIEYQIEMIEIEIEKFKVQLEKLEQDMEQPANLHSNTEKILEEF